MKLIDDIEIVLATGVKAITIKRRQMKQLLERDKTPSRITGKLRRAMYRAEQRSRATADALKREREVK